MAGRWCSGPGGRAAGPLPSRRPWLTPVHQGGVLARKAEATKFRVIEADLEPPSSRITPKKDEVKKRSKRRLRVGSAHLVRQGPMTRNPAELKDLHRFPSTEDMADSLTPDNPRKVTVGSYRQALGPGTYES